MRQAYQKRVDTFLRLSATKVIGLENMDAEDEYNLRRDMVERAIKGLGTEIEETTQF